MYILNMIRPHMNTLMAGVAFAPPEIQGMGSFGDGAGGGGMQMPPDESAGGEIDDNSHVPTFGDESGDDSENPDDADDIFAAFGDGGDVEPDDTSISNSGINDIPADQVTAMQTQVSNAIKNMRIPEDAIPDDFDFGDRKQVMQLMNRTVQASVSQAMSVVFKPVQLALAHTVNQLQSQIDSKIEASRTQGAAMDIIASTVPEINNPKYSGMIRQMDTSLKSQGKKPAERAKVLRKMLNQMGIQDSSSGSSRRSSSPGARGVDNRTVKTGTMALDSLFGPMPTNKR